VEFREKAIIRDLFHCGLSLGRGALGRAQGVLDLLRRRGPAEKHAAGGVCDGDVRGTAGRPGDLLPLGRREVGFRRRSVGTPEGRRKGRVLAEVEVLERRLLFD
jgi:hypothetical protein